MMPAVRVPAPTVTIEPGWEIWSRALGSAHSGPARAQLGLDPTAPIVFSGHQPIVFHNGILAKLIAQHQAATRCSATPVWIVADQDHAQPGQIRIPIGEGKALDDTLVDLLAPGTVPGGVPTASLAPQTIQRPTDPRLYPLVDHLNRHTSAASLGEQFARATIALASERLGIEAPKLLFASDLLRSGTLWALVERMLKDPRACVSAYNASVRAHPGAGVRELTIEGDRVELPLWGLIDRRARVAIDSQNISDFDRAALAPRGLLMSLLVRAHLGELFIHGTGGWKYDRITQDWANAWLGIELAPMALTTATQRLDLGFAPEQVIDPARAIWEAHHARHTPASVGDTATQHQKDILVSRIAALHDAGDDPAPDFARMQALLDEYRASHNEALAALDKRVDRARAMHKQLTLAADRTWPFVLFDDPALRALKDAVASALG